MAVDPKKLIAAINPNVYCLELKEKYGEIQTIRKDVKKILNESLEKKDARSYLAAAEKAELVETKWMDFDDVIKTPFKLEGNKNPIEQHTLVYETTGGALEKVYFWLHDYLLNRAEYGEARKIADNFAASPGSAYFAEMGARATRMQEEAMKIMATVNTVVKSVMNTTYDLKDFQLRLNPYNNLNSKDVAKKEAALYSIKQRWLDEVDIKKGNSSMKAMAVSGINAPNFVMLIDAFMAAKSLDELEKLDLNERVKRIVKQRYQEFEIWLKESERELKKRYEIEKTYLKSQYNSLQLYARWVKPYLESAKALEQRGTMGSSLVTAFETSVFELVLVGIGEYNMARDIQNGDLPKYFSKAIKRKYTPVVLVELKFRSIPERSQRGSYGFVGKAEVTFTSFSLNEDELRLFQDQLDKDNFGDLTDLMAGATTLSLQELKEDVDKYLNEEPEKEEAEEKKSEDTNPFSALWSILFSKQEKKKGDEKGLKIRPDTKEEEVVRSQVSIEARKKCRKFYEAFKKNYGMPTF